MTIQLEAGAKSVVLPAGRYIIGDPCYHVPDAQWDAVLDQSDFFGMSASIGSSAGAQCWANFTTFDGRQGTVVAFATVHGDGRYKDIVDREYPVDAGLIGIIPFEDIDPRELDLESVHVIEFKTPFTCKEEDGVIVFGYIEINTDNIDDSDFDDLSDEPETW